MSGTAGGTRPFPPSLTRKDMQGLGMPSPHNLAVSPARLALAGFRGPDAERLDATRRGRRGSGRVLRSRCRRRNRLLVGCFGGGRRGSRTFLLLFVLQALQAGAEHLQAALIDPNRDFGRVERTFGDELVEADGSSSRHVSGVDVSHASRQFELDLLAGQSGLDVLYQHIDELIRLV